MLRVDIQYIYNIFCITGEEYESSGHRIQRDHSGKFTGYLPEGTTEIVSRGAKGVDTSAREYAADNNIPLTEYKPEYSRYGRGAPLKRNITIIENADIVLAFWDGQSKGTKFVIDSCEKRNIPIRVYRI